MPEGVNTIMWSVGTGFSSEAGLSGLAVYPLNSKAEVGESSWADIVGGRGAREFTSVELELSDIKFKGHDWFDWESESEDSPLTLSPIDLINAATETLFVEQAIEWSIQLKKQPLLSEFTYQVRLNRLENTFNIAT